VKALLLAALLAQDGGFTGDIYAGCREYESSPPAEQLDGGAWLVPKERFQLVACRMAACHEALTPERPTVASYLWVAGVALVAGFAAGAVVVATLPR
jgi:hypothetical protein